jgi:hypothetical protein
VVKLKAKTKLSEKKAKSGLTVTFSRAGDVSQPLLVHYDLRGSARNALDYAALPRAIEIPARKKSAKLLVRPFRDDAGEPTETLEIAREDEVKKSKRR